MTEYLGVAKAICGMAGIILSTISIIYGIALKRYDRAAFFMAWAIYAWEMSK